MTIRQAYKEVQTQLDAILGVTEGDSAARLIFEDTAGYDRKFIFMNGDRDITDYMLARINAAVEAVRRGEPVQYAVGKARFEGNDYSVDPSVLIPRPETEGLVDIITDIYSRTPDLRVLDIGTGSGCIAISLARVLPFSRVKAFDVSDSALAVARYNALRLKATVDFSCTDILKATPAPDSFDIIVSNPPYICRSEAADMDARVLDHEPALALFVPDDDPLLFYRAIARYASTALCCGGRLFFEINARFPDRIRQLLEDTGFTDIDIRRDFCSRPRYALASKP